MISGRPDWCVSRQRSWGVPDSVFYCNVAMKPLPMRKSFIMVADIFQRETADAWYNREAKIYAR
jgi:isoleucyl-tRNA synthetase